MLRAKQNLAVLILIVGLILLIRHDLHTNLYLRSNQCETTLIPLEEIKAMEREKNLAPLLNNQTKPDDPKLIQVIRDYFIDPPSQYRQKMSKGLIKTPQARKIDNILQNKTNGFYIECGALDGERASNSIFFEKKRNWDGVLIEMDPAFYMQIRGKNRRAYSLNACLSPYTYPIEMTFKESMSGKGVLVMMDNPKKTMRKSYCFPIYSIMLALNRTRVDYFSLDVEGFELTILKTVPFDKLDITTLSVEYEHAPHGGWEYINYMKDHGYDLDSRVGRDKDTYAWDYIFVKKSYSPS